MAKHKKTIQLLILEDSQNEAERLMSLFRNAGHSTRMQRVSNNDELLLALEQTWDLFIVAASSEHLDLDQVIANIGQQKKDLPIIRLLADNDPDRFSEALQNGAQDAVPEGEDERLLFVALREIKNLAARRELREAQLALKEAEKRCQLLLDSSVDAIAYVHEGMHIYANRAYLSLFGYEDAEELEGMPMTDLISSADQTAFKDFLKRHQHSGQTTELNCQGLKADGSGFDMHIQCSAANFDGESCIQAIIRAHSDNAELEEKLKELSSLDGVTGLFNRSYFLEQIEQAYAHAEASGQNSALAYIRLNDYAKLQSELGLTGLDTLLADISALLRKLLPDTAQLARFGDDAFGALLACDNAEQWREPLQKLLMTFESHLFEVNGRTVQVNLNIGLALINEITKATVALDRANQCADSLTEPNSLKIFNPKDELAAQATRGNLAALIKNALDNNGFRLLFQPIISLRGENREYYEVLLRLKNMQGEEVSPKDFLPCALEHKLADKLDRWVLTQAIEKLVAHRNTGHDTSLFINLSAASLQTPDLLIWLNDALKKAGLEANALILQINESDAISYLKPAKAFTHHLAKMNCQVALSQFGCAANPMNTLKHIHSDFVKVDASYTQELSNPEAQESLKVLLDALHNDAKQSIVPMVESAVTLSVLWQAGASYIQGHYLQAPTDEMNYEFAGEE